MSELLNDITKTSIDIVKNKLPVESYQSTVGVYGGKIIMTPDNKMVYSPEGVVNKIDIEGDKFLRKFDDHVVKKPIKLLMTHPRWFLDIVFHAEAMRHRGTPQEIAKNAERLGLSEFYGLHPMGIEIKKPEIFTHGIAIDDIFKSNEINSPVLNDIDRFQALAEATKYISNIHFKYGAIGDVVGDIMFQKKEGSKVLDPVLNIPDVILNPSKKRMKLIMESKVNKVRQNKETALTKEELNKITKESTEFIEREQKTIDITELMISSVFSEIRRNPNNPLVEKTVSTILENYQDNDVLKVAKSLIKRGRHTLPGSKTGGILSSFFSMHNMAHLGADKNYSQKVREIIIKEFD